MTSDEAMAIAGAINNMSTFEGEDPTESLCDELNKLGFGFSFVADDYGVVSVHCDDQD